MTSLIYFLSLSSAEPISSEVKAPFGLEWGVAKGELKLSYTECEPAQGIFEVCKLEQVPKGVSMGSWYSLIYHKEDGLQKITMVSKDIDNDISGSEGKSMYNKIKKGLTKKYSKPESYEYIGRKLYKEYDEFYQCLKYEGCGAYASFWNPKGGGSISLQLKGLTRGLGFVTVVYESKKWTKIIDDLNKKKESSDEDAF